METSSIPVQDMVGESTVLLLATDILTSGIEYRSEMPKRNAKYRK
jgi:hypothetical protein